MIQINIGIPISVSHELTQKININKKDNTLKFTTCKKLILLSIISIKYF